MNPNKALWEKGDFTRIAALMRRSGETLVKSLGITPPLRVLDLGCGDGTTALPLARLGADVVGIDIARNLVEAGNARAAKAGLSRLTFQEGDASNLQGVADHTFDLTLSVFGAMFAPRPFDVAREMVRVTRPGGRIVMGNWIPNDPTSFVSQLLKTSASFTPPPPARLRQPDDLGRGYARHRPFWPGRRAQGKHNHGEGYVPLRRAGQNPGGPCRSVQTVLWPDDERLRGRRKRWQARPALQATSGTGEHTKHQQ